MPRADADVVPAFLAATAAFAIVVAVLAGVAAVMLLVRQRRLRAALTHAEARAAALGLVLDVWQWQTDALGNLVDLRPPRTAGDAAWRLAQRRGPIDALLVAADAAALRARMRAGDALDAVDVEVKPKVEVDVGGEAGDFAAPHHFLLAGRPLRDGDGRLAGYAGTLVAASANDANGANSANSAGGEGGAGGAGGEVVDGAAAARVARVQAQAPPSRVDVAAGEHESFSYTVSHDLRAPIRVVEGFTKIVKEDYGRVIDRVGHDHLDRVLAAAARMNGMIDALLALSRLSSQPLARVPVNLSQLAEYVLEDLRRQSPERAVETEVEPGLLAVGDPTLLRMALENLLGNAWKYTGQAEIARIAFGRGGEGSGGGGSGGGDASAATFTVSDNGAGFDMRFADRLFGVFQRLHSASEFAGTGVGLASVRRIVRRHGGDIWAESRPGHGARFSFSLPLR